MKKNMLAFSLAVLMSCTVMAQTGKSKKALGVNNPPKTEQSPEVALRTQKKIVRENQLNQPEAKAVQKRKLITTAASEKLVPAN